MKCKIGLLMLLLWRKVRGKATATLYLKDGDYDGCSTLLPAKNIDVSGNVKTHNNMEMLVL